MFKNYGLNNSVMKFLQPDIIVSEWYSGCFDCGCKYVLRATVHDNAHKSIEQLNYIDVLQWEATLWTKVSHSFKNQSDAAYLILHHSGVDTQCRAYHYGTKISGSLVKVVLPLKLISAETEVQV